MGLKENLINYLYDSMKPIIESDIIKSKREDVMQGYRLYLEDRFANVESYASDLEKCKSVFLASEQRMWQGKNGTDKYTALMPDEAFKKIKLISDYAYTCALKKAREKVEATLAAEDATAKKTELIDLLPKVGMQNLEKARQLVSDSIVDLEYSAGLTEYTSLRIGQVRNALTK